MKVLLFLLPLFAWAISPAEGNFPAEIARNGAVRETMSERAYSGEHLFRSSTGTYSCVECGLALFKSTDKYDCGNGWPSFKQPIAPKNVYYLEDRGLSFKRYEVLCSGCDSHLGHVFNDGPPPKNLRYSINSISLIFIKE